MKIHFYKYQGTGNDFIILDNRNWSYTALTMDRVKFLCDRRFGIGADGLMLLNQKSGFDFEMKYYNADGRESSMCGNGGRCMVKFAYHLGMRKNKYLFSAVDGPHEAEIDDDGTVSLKMRDVNDVQEYHNDFILDTGSPHYVKIVSDVMDYDVFHRGMDIRYSSEFAREGINVNFVEQKKADEIIVRTYERGVEDETLSCGTGVTASALVCYHNDVGYNDVTVITKGGKLVMEFDRAADGSFHDIWLCGPAEKVFEGEIELGPADETLDRCLREL
jgi:diaminopimelate epimerase